MRKFRFHHHSYKIIYSISVLIPLVILLLVVAYSFEDQSLRQYVLEQEIKRNSLQFSKTYIHVSSAEHLDEHREYLADIKLFIHKRDNLLSKPVYDKQYVRVRFEKELRNGNDITIVPRIISGHPRIFVYKKDTNVLVGQFDSLIPFVENVIYLTNLTKNTDTFDLRVVGGDIQLDFIIDPLPAPFVTNLYPAGHSFNTSQNISINATVSDADGVDAVLANVTYPNGTVEQLTLTNVSGNYTVTFTVPKNIGLFNITFIANDTSGNINSTEKTNFTTTLKDPTSLHNLRVWYDAGDNTTLYTDTGCTTLVSADLDEVLCWENKAEGNNATVVSGLSGAIYRSNSSELISGSTVLRFNKSNSSLYETGIDIRATTLEDISLFAVYKPRTNDTSDQGQAIWGNDDGSWDRFYYSLFSESAGLGTDGIDDGLISLGGASNGLAIDGAGIVDTVLLLTVVYDGNVSGGVNSGPTDGSQVYFDGELQTLFTDESHATAAQTQMFIGRDGDNGHYDGDLAEFFMYEGVLTTCEIESINNYLGARYGKDFSGISDNYGFSGPHNNSINGISEYSGDCNLSVEITSASSSIATISNPSSLDLNDTLTFAHDNVGLDLSSEAPENYTSRINQSWRVDVDNVPGEVSVSFDLSSTGLVIASSDFALLIDDDGNFSNATEHTAGFSSTDETITFTEVSFTNGDYFSLGVTEKSPSVSFVDPTPPDSLITINTTIFVNISSDALGSDHYTFLDFDDSLHLWMRMDDVNGSGDPTDISRHANNGTLIGDAKINATGKFGDGAHFDGSGDYILLPASDTLIPNTNSWTVSAWFNANGISSGLFDNRIVTIRSSGSNSAFSLTLGNSNQIQFFYRDSGGSGTTENVTSASLGEWYHYAVTYNGSAFLLYVNGTLEKTVEDSLESPTSNLARIAANPAGSSQFFDGAIDDVLIFNRTLSVTEIAALYNATTTSYQNNFTNLSIGNYTFIGYSVGENGKKNQTETRTVSIILPTPTIDFVGPTPLDAAFVSEDSIIVNITTDAPDSDHYTFVDFDDSLILWMRMDDLNASGDPSDLSRHGNNGTLIGDAVINSTGRFGDGSHFDGSGDSIDVFDHESLKFGTGNFTYSLWFYSNTVPSATSQLLCKRTNGLGNYEAQIESGGKIRSWIGDSGGGAANIDSVTTIEANVWYHVLVTRYDGTLYLYVNGTLENQTTSNHNVTSSSVLRLGQDTGGSSEYFDGAIDEVLIFNRSFSSSEVLSLYNATANQYDNNFTNLEEGNHTFIGYTVGVNANKNQTETRTVTIDTLIPEISFTSPTAVNNSFVVQDWILVNVSVVEANEANITFSLYNSSVDEINSSIFTDSTRSINFTSLGDGVYFYNVSIFDLTGKKNSTETRQITLDTMPPSVTDPNPTGQTPLIGSTIGINATVTDSVVVDTVLANVTFPNGSFSLLTLSDTGGSVYNDNFTIPDIAGVFNITFIANDTAGNVNNSVTGSFVSSITDPTDLSNLRAWYDAADNETLYTNEECTDQVNADGDTIRCWRDKSSYAANATNVSGKGTPVFATNTFNGHSVVSFNKTQEDTLRHVLSSQYVSNFTIFVVIQSKDSSPATFESFFSNGEPADSTHFQIDYTNDSGQNSFRYGATTKFNFETFSNDIKLYSVIHNSTAIELFNEGKTVNSGTTTEGTTFEHYRINQNRNGDRHHESYIGEIILYDRVLSVCEREAVNVYLGNKYGKDFFGTRDSYGFGAPHNNDINGIGKFPSNCSSIITISSASSSFLTVSNPNSLDVNDSLTFGHDNGGLLTATDAPSSYRRVNQSWRADEDGEVGTVTVSFDFSDNTSLLSYDNFVLLVDNDTIFSDANITNTSGSVSGNVITFIGSDLTNAAYFTIGFNDTTVPAVIDLLPTQHSNYTIRTLIEVRANVTDIIGVDTVLANITLPNGSFDLLTLPLSGGSIHNTSYTIPDADGRYNITFIANDTSGNLNATETTFFTARNFTTPTIEFISPTPANNSVTGSFFVVNISSNDTDGNHYTFVDLDDTLIGWWRFDLTNESGDPVDESIYGLNASLENGTLINSTGKFGDAAHFDGTNDAIIVPDNTLLEGFSGFTISAWVLSHSAYNPHTAIVAKGDIRSSTGAYGLKFRDVGAGSGECDTATGDIRLHVRIDSTAEIVCYGEQDDYLGLWTHYVGTWNGTRLALYINGQLVRNLTTPAGSINDVSDPLRIGGDFYVSEADGYFDGAIDDVLIFNRSLNGSEIESLYNASATQYDYNFSSLASGTHTFSGYAVSINGKRNQTEKRVVTADTTPPSVTSLEPVAETVVNKDTALEIAANVTDSTAVDVVYANITYPNGTTARLNLSLAVENKYNASFNPSGVTGTFNVTIVANDTLGNINSTEMTSFTGTQLTYPGGISTTIQLWLDAGKNETVYQDGCGENVSTQGDVVSCWQDRSGQGHHAESNGTSGPTFHSNSSSLINFNPTIDFNGIDTYLEDADGESYINGVSEFSTFVVIDAVAAASDGYIFNAESGSEAEAPWGLRFDDTGALSGRDDTLKTGINTGTTELYEGNEDNIASADPMLASVHWTSGEAPTLFVNGRSITMHPTTTKSGTLTGGDYVRIGHEANQDFWSGSIAELIYYQTRLNTTAQYKVASYLAIKYGLTLDSNVNYVDSDNTTIYASGSTHASYTNDIAGIGIDATSDLNQTQSKSVNTDSIVTMNNASSLDNKEFLVWGNDNGALSEETNNFPLGIQTRLNRTWRVDRTGDVGLVTILFNLSGLTITGDARENFTLLIDSTDTNFSAGARMVSATNFSDFVVRFDSVNFTGDDYFTLATSNDTKGPNVTSVVASPSSTYNLAQRIEINATVADTNGISSVRANITLPNASVEQITLDLLTGDIYNSSFTVSSLTGTYTVRIMANDTIGNVNSTETTTFQVVNDPATPSSVEINGGSDITLTEGTNTTIIGSATITDQNGYTHISSVAGFLFLTTTGANAADNRSTHYTQTCTSNGDGSGNTESYNCTFNVSHYALPTDSGANRSETNWTFLIAPVDAVSAGTNGTDVVEMDTLLAFTINPSLISFGSLNLSTNTTNTNQEINVTNLGNVQLDVVMSGTNLSCSPGIIPVTFLEYEDNPFTYGVGIDLLESGVELNLDVISGYEGNSTPQKTTYYGFGVPNTAVGGSCSGTIILTGQSDPDGD